MSYETYRLIFLAGAIAAGVLFAAAVVLFFVLKIPRVIGDLTGATARKAIAGIRSEAEHKGEAQKPGQGGTPEKRAGRKSEQSTTAKLARTAKTPEPSAPQSAGAETTVLDAPGSETTVLAPEGPETAQLKPEMAPGAEERNDGGETAQLGPAPFQPEPPAADPASDFVIEYEVTHIHSNEAIQ